MWLLGLDTATPATTVAVADVSGDACRVVAELDHIDPRRHGEVVSLLIDDAVASAGIDVNELEAVAVGVGPGAFTGLRVGIATAKALSFALDLPCYGVCTLDALAWATRAEAAFVVVTDARRREYFWRRYDDHATPIGDPAVGDATALAASVGRTRCFVSSGTQLPSETSGEPAGLPSAAALCELVAFRLANGHRLGSANPIYLRSPDVAPPAPAKSVLT